MLNRSSIMLNYLRQYKSTERLIKELKQQEKKQIERVRYCERDLQTIQNMLEVHQQENEERKDYLSRITDEDAQMMLTLICLEGATIDEVAEVFHMSAKTVHRRINQALKDLQK